jgi:outer membrane protein assembly factor BamA
MAALVFDNSLFGWTGPIYGRRYRAQVSRTFGTFELNEAMLDFRNYWNYKQSVVFASRFTALHRTGRDADRFGVYWGGPYYIRGYDAGSFELGANECETSRRYGGEESVSACPVRDQLIGSSAAFMNLELRVPIIKELQIGLIGAFPPVDLVTFFDGGLAWDNEICMNTSALDPNSCAEGAAEKVHVVWDRKPGQDPYFWREPVFSYGAGLRINIFYTVLRLDYSVPVNRPDRSFRDGVFSLSFGPSF